ncbi:hypothetical protein BH11PLA2_BH11PLA2_26920 [soil metagenome]
MNSVDNVIDASISGATVTSVNGSVNVAASDNAVIHADAGGMALALSAASKNQVDVVGTVGASVAINRVANSTTTAIENAIVSVAKNITLPATTYAVIDAVTVAAAGSVAAGKGKFILALAGAGSGSDNTITNTTAATVTGSKVTATNGAFTAVALDQSTITVKSLGAALAVSFGAENSATVAIGVSIALNNLANTVRAAVEGSDLVRVGGAVTITATDSANILATTVAATLAVPQGNSAAVSVSGGGATAVNQINSHVNALLNATTVGTAAPVGSVSVIGAANGQIASLVLSVSAAAAFAKNSAGVGVAVGVGVARNIIGYERVDAVPHDFTSDNAPTTLSTGLRVKINGGPLNGDVFRYVGLTVNGSGRRILPMGLHRQSGRSRRPRGPHFDTLQRCNCRPERWRRHLCQTWLGKQCGWRLCLRPLGHGGGRCDLVRRSRSTHLPLGDQRRGCVD